jgi:dsRNA-specific ribonuclease
MEMTLNEIDKGPRDKSFKNLIYGLLHRSGMRESYIEHLLGDDGMDLYNTAFTAVSADPDDNYEFLEQIGDMTANQFIVNYTYHKYPKLQTSQGVKIVARVRINHGSREKFAKLGEDLGFWPYISADIAARESSKKDLLEDAFEAFCGATQWLLDQKIRVGIGYPIVYDLLSHIYDEMVPISLKYEDLFDPKTRLKELFDRSDVKSQVGDWQFLSEERNLTTRLTTSILYVIPPGVRKKDERTKNKWYPIAKGSAAKKINAEQIAASAGIEWLRAKNYFKIVPKEYLDLVSQ